MNITASQTIWMPLHVVPGQPACLDSPSPHKLPQTTTPAYRPPKGMPDTQASLRPRKLWFIAASLPGIWIGGRMSSASIEPPGSWPRHPSTLRLSRLPQPPSRRIPKPPSIPSTHRTPRHFAVASCGYRRRSRPQNAVPYSSINQTVSINQDPLTPGETCLILRYTPDQPGKVCAEAHVHLLPPL